jgi:hypothetical protein
MRKWSRDARSGTEGVQALARREFISSNVIEET